MRAIILKTAKKSRGTIPRAKVRKVVAAVYANPLNTTSKKKNGQTSVLAVRKAALETAR